MKKYQHPNVEMFNLSVKDVITVSASGGLFFGNKDDSGSGGEQLSMNGGFSDF